MNRFAALVATIIAINSFLLATPSVWAGGLGVHRVVDDQQSEGTDRAVSQGPAYDAVEFSLKIMPAPCSERFKDTRLFENRDFMLSTLGLSGRWEWQRWRFELGGQASMWSISYRSTTRTLDTLTGGSLSYQSIYSTHVTIGKRLQWKRSTIIPHVGYGIALFNYLVGPTIGDTSYIENSPRTVAYGLAPAVLTAV